MGLRPKGHHYPVYVVQIAIQLIIQGLNSLRGVEKTNERVGAVLAVANARLQ